MNPTESAPLPVGATAPQTEVDDGAPTVAVGPYAAGEEENPNPALRNVTIVKDAAGNVIGKTVASPSSSRETVAVLKCADGAYEGERYQLIWARDGNYRCARHADAFNDGVTEAADLAKIPCSGLPTAADVKTAADRTAEANAAAKEAISGNRTTPVEPTQPGVSVRG